MQKILALVLSFGLFATTTVTVFADDGGQTCFASGCEYDGSGGWVFDPQGWQVYA